MHIAYKMLHSKMLNAIFSKCTNVQIALLISKFSIGLNVEANFSSLLDLQLVPPPLNAKKIDK